MINGLINKKRQFGVTLIEMMITLAIAAILLTLVAPNVQSILTRNKITAEINEMSGLLRFARYTAIDQQIDTIVCPTTDFTTCSNDWNSPKMVFVDANANNGKDAAEPILASSQAISATNTVTSTIDSIEFIDSGVTVAASTILICPNTKDAKFARALFVTLQGRTRISEDANNNGTDEDLANTELSCP